MRKVLAVGFLFFTGLLASPALAINGIDGDSNCAFQLPYRMKDLMQLQQDQLKGNTGLQINAVNVCTNQTETIQIAAISADDSGIRIDGYAGDARRQIMIRK